MKVLDYLSLGLVPSRPISSHLVPSRPVSHLYTNFASRLALIKGNLILIFLLLSFYLKIELIIGLNT